MGPVPPLPETEKDIQLWLTTRFKADVPEDPEEKKLYNATKGAVVSGRVCVCVCLTPQCRRARSSRAAPSAH